jgi:hypothetical protein
MNVLILRRKRLALKSIRGQGPVAGSLTVPAGQFDFHSSGKSISSRMSRTCHPERRASSALRNERKVEGSRESIPDHAAAGSSLKNIFLCNQRNCRNRKGPYLGFARMIADHENATLSFPDQPLDINPRESALIRGKNP